MNTFFKLKENKTTVSTEIMAGVTTFFAMSYILFVNPSILSETGMPFQAVFFSDHYCFNHRYINHGAVC
ncbi:hypothetical protein [Enterococcus faecalis]|uniref:hypothetical protein n=1 Tax=Enterococcus faecalis TaxID=1351 RepID=UPI003EBB81B1